MNKRQVRFDDRSTDGVRFAKRCKGLKDRERATAMTKEQIRNLCLSLPGVTENVAWGKDLLFKVAGKMFLCTGLDSGSCYSFKCLEAAFHELTELQGVNPAPYLARTHWVQVDPAACRLNAGQIEKLIRQSYDLVVAKLPNKTQRSLQDKPNRSRGESPGGFVIDGIRRRNV